MELNNARMASIAERRSATVIDVSMMFHLRRVLLSVVLGISISGQKESLMNDVPDWPLKE